MATRSTDDIWERLGSLQAQNDAILRELSRAGDNRKELYDKLDDTSKRLGAVEDLAAEATETLKDIAPTVEEFRHLKAKAAGVILVLVFIGSMLTAIVTLFLDQIKSALGWPPTA